MVRSVILQTACGCRSTRTIEASALGWNVALFPIHSTLTDGLSSPDEPIPIFARRFMPAGRFENGMEVWREREDRQAIPPGAPVHLTHGEWADAVARFRLWCKGDLPAADSDFLNRHAGGTILMHKNGVLVGAFYPAPGWQHSEESVRMFSALRELIAESGDA